MQTYGCFPSPAAAALFYSYFPPTAQTLDLVCALTDTVEVIRLKKTKKGRTYNGRRIAACAAAGLTAAAVLLTGVLSGPIDAQAADTLLGIEKLRSDVKDNGRQYVVLEIVPDHNTAEIGFLFQDYEPILGGMVQDDDGNWHWANWKTILGTYTTEDERKKFIQDKKEELKKYYESVGIKDHFPVEAASGEYEESDGPAEGFQKVQGEGSTREGWFTTDGTGGGAGGGAGSSVKYQLTFENVLNSTRINESNKNIDTVLPNWKTEVYYTVSSETKLDNTNLASLSDSMPIYTKDGEIYVYAGTKAELFPDGTMPTFLNGVKLKLPDGDESDDEDNEDEDEDEDENKDEEGDGENSEGDENKKNGEGENGGSGSKSEGESSGSGGSKSEGESSGSGGSTGTPGGSTGSESNPSGGSEGSGGGTGSSTGSTTPGSSTSTPGGTTPGGSSGSAGAGGSGSSAGGGTGESNGTGSSTGNSTSGGTSEGSGGTGGSTSTSTPSGGSEDDGEGDGGTTVSAITSAGGSLQARAAAADRTLGTWTLLVEGDPSGGTDPDPNTNNNNNSGDPSGNGGSGNENNNGGGNSGTSGPTTSAPDPDNTGNGGGTDPDSNGNSNGEGSTDPNSNGNGDGSTDPNSNGSGDGSTDPDSSGSGDGNTDPGSTGGDDGTDPGSTGGDDGTDPGDGGTTPGSNTSGDGEDNEDSEDEEEQVSGNSARYGTRRMLAPNATDYYTVTFKKVSDKYSDVFDETSGDFKTTAGGGMGASTGTYWYKITEITEDANGAYTFSLPTGTAGGTPGTPGTSGGIDGIDEVKTQRYTFPGKVLYCKNTFTNSQWFRKYVVDLDEDDYGDFPVKVLSYTPQELNELDEVPQYDFLYLNAGLRQVSKMGEGSGSILDPATKEVKQIAPYGEYEDAAGDTVTNDINSDVMKNLYQQAIAGAKPCLVDGGILYTDTSDVVDGGESVPSEGTVINDDLKETKIFRLAALLCQSNPDSWYEEHGDYASMSIGDLTANLVDDGDRNYVSEHIYCRYGDDSIVNDQFYQATIYKDGGEIQPGFQAVLEEIQLDNAYREADSSGNYESLSTDISQASALRHILSYADRRTVSSKTHIKVLEIEPAKADEPDLTLEQLQKWAPDVESADITVMTTAEFIGKIEKLNENYDLIYIGTSADHLNMRYWTDASYSGKPDGDHVAAGTAFNDADMDGLIYYNVGDLRVVSMSLAGQLDTEYYNNDRNNDVYYYNFVRYGGNDITEEKKEALLSFLDGAYPVVVADDFFTQPVTVYASPNYSGARVSVQEGDYNHDEMLEKGIAGGDISAVKVRDGYQVTFYNGYYFEYDPNTGANRCKVTFTESKSDFNNERYPSWGSNSGTWNNMPNSFKVEKISDEVQARQIDEDHIDNSSYMYDFVKEAMEKKYVNFYSWSDITRDSELFQFYLNRPKITLTNTYANGQVKEGNDIYYVNSDYNGKYNLQYRFTIKNEGMASYDTNYRCRLYIDVNSDGKFSSTEEIGDVSLTQNGAYASPDALRADREYVLSREVPAGYKGLLPWRIEVTQADNEDIYASMSGYTKLEGMEQEQIKIIQIGRDRLHDVTWTGGEGEELFDLGKEIETEGTIYHKLVYGGDIDGVHYEGIADEYDIDVTFKTIEQYEQEYAANNDYLKDFNMLILGFSDIYGDFTGDAESGPMGAIVDFVNSGKSVLFAHDTTSFFNYPKKAESGFPARNGTGVPWRDNYNDRRTHGDYHNASTLNFYIRNLVGMDRYGILSSDVLRRGQALTQGSEGYNQVVASRYEVAYKPKSNRTETVPQVHGYTYLSISSKDYAADGFSATGGSWGNSDKKTFTKWELYSDNYGNLPDTVFENKYTNIRYDQVVYKNNATDYGEVIDPRNGEIDNLYVTKVNDGQIVHYPYKLQDTFEVAETHGQYYQLDYTADDDGDGQSDLVVWYCLGARGAEGAETVYSQSPNDVRNNYYIYNKGNITYTGMGHSTQRAVKYTVEEAKLFINTIIAAYQSGMKDPYITVLERGVPESEPMRVLYRYYDAQPQAGDASLDDDAAAGDTYEKIYFTVQDINFIKGSRKIATHVYYADAGGTETISAGGVDVRVSRLPDEIYDVATGAKMDAENLQSGGIYYVLVPRSILRQSSDGLDLYFEAQSTITTDTAKQNVYVTEKVYAKLQILQAYLFDLE